jgi:hypothetical protein
VARGDTALASEAGQGALLQDVLTVQPFASDVRSWREPRPSAQWYSDLCEEDSGCDGTAPGHSGALAEVKTLAFVEISQAFRGEEFRACGGVPGGVLADCGAGRRGGDAGAVAAEPDMFAADGQGGAGVVEGAGVRKDLAEGVGVDLVGTRAGPGDVADPAGRRFPEHWFVEAVAGEVRVERILTAVVLPAPFGPSRENTVPSGTARSMPSRTVLSP